MFGKRTTIQIEDLAFEAVLVSTPDYFSADDSYCEVRLKISGTSWVQAAFHCYPVTSGEQKWEAPVQWTDGLILYVPDLEYATIVRAIEYIVSQGYLVETFHECPEPDSVLPGFESLPRERVTEIGDDIERSIKQKLTQIFIQFKQLGLAHSANDLRRLLLKYGEAVIDEIAVE